MKSVFSVRHQAVDAVFLLIILSACGWFAAAILSAVHFGGSQDQNRRALGELVQGMTIQQEVPVQEFILTDTICYHVMFATYRRTNPCRLQISLRQGEYLHSFRLDASVLKDNQLYPLCFPAKGLLNGTAILEIAGVDGVPMQSPTVWMTTDIPYGGAIHQGIQSNKGLVFQSYAKRPLGKYLGWFGIFLLSGMLSLSAVSVRYPEFAKIIVTWCNQFKKKLENSFIVKKITDCRLPVLTFSLIAWTLSLVMATVSQFSAHPDEGMHSASASYYENHHVPPPVGDPASLSTYKSRYGVSYINQSGIDYFLIGKFSVLIKPYVSLKDFYLHRCFNIFLFFCLCLIIWFAEDRMIFFPIIITPQIWYIASYTNNDFFPLAMMMILCFELLAEGSFCNRAIVMGESLFYAVPAGVIFGILSISKSNYLVFVLYAACYLFWRVLKINQFRINWKIGCSHAVRSCMLILFCAVSIFAFRMAFDIYQNGLDKHMKLKNHADQMAEIGFRPLDIEADIHKTAPGLRLKDKGVSLESLISEKRWHTLSLYSFMGVYGWMKIKTSDAYYNWTTCLFCVLLCYTGVQGVATFQAEKIFFLMFSFFFIWLMAGISLYYSWSYDFQPQGRYLFPALGTMTILIHELREHLNRIALGLIVSILFIGSFWSFLFVGIYHIEKMV